jgi:thiamine-phosphate pyrophosphorylase
LDDGTLTERLKRLRHNLAAVEAGIGLAGLSARAAATDVGAPSALPMEAKRASVAEIVRANAKRVQESLRVLEEFARLDQQVPGRLDIATLEQARFEAYEVERQLVDLVQRRAKVQRIKGLYAIVDRQALRGRDPATATRQIIAGGAQVVQWRDKTGDKGAVLATARALRELCQRANVLFVVNDHADVAILCEADGIHVGQEDLPVSELRKLMPVGMVVGCSANNLSEAVKAQADGADYLGVGAIYPTGTKAVTRQTSLEVLKAIKEKVAIPVVGIGGINHDNIHDVMQTGADGAAVISALLGSEDVEDATRRMMVLIAQATTGERR